MKCGNGAILNGKSRSRVLDCPGDIWYIMCMDETATVTTREELENLLVLTEEEKLWFSNRGGSLPLKISRYYLSLIDPGDPHDPLRRQVVPTVRETCAAVSEQSDPLAESSHSVLPRLIHRYRNRVAFLVTDRCATYCRHCFRRRFTASSDGAASPSEVSEAAAYVGSHPEVREMLLTGGDPLTLADDRLDGLISAIRTARPDLVLRLCTRLPATYPMRVTGDLVSMIASHKTAPVYLMTQFNHDREFTAESRRAVSLFVDAGIPAMNQTVLLRGVNDDADALERLMNALVANRVKPYYLFQGDLVNGTGHFRVPLERGFALESELRRRVSGLAMPVYAVDLPGGGGKVPLGKRYLEGRNANGSWIFCTVEGERRIYPDPMEAG